MHAHSAVGTQSCHDARGSHCAVLAFLKEQRYAFWGISRSSRGRYAGHSMDDLKEPDVVDIFRAMIRAVGSTIGKPVRVTSFGTDPPTGAGGSYFYEGNNRGKVRLRVSHIGSLSNIPKEATDLKPSMDAGVRERQTRITDASVALGCLAHELLHSAGPESEAEFHRAAEERSASPGALAFCEAVADTARLAFQKTLIGRMNTFLRDRNFAPINPAVREVEPISGYPMHVALLSKIIDSMGYPQGDANREFLLKDLVVTGAGSNSLTLLAGMVADSAGLPSEQNGNVRHLLQSVFDTAASRQTSLSSASNPPAKAQVYATAGRQLGIMFAEQVKALAKKSMVKPAVGSAPLEQQKHAPSIAQSRSTRAHELAEKRREEQQNEFRDRARKRAQQAAITKQRQPQLRRGGYHL